MRQFGRKTGFKNARSPVPSYSKIRFGGKTFSASGGFGQFGTKRKKSTKDLLRGGVGFAIL